MIQFYTSIFHTSIIVMYQNDLVSHIYHCRCTILFIVSHIANFHTSTVEVQNWIPKSKSSFMVSSVRSLWFAWSQIGSLNTSKKNNKRSQKPYQSCSNPIIHIYILYIHTLPNSSIYGTLTNISPTNHPNVGRYTIHGAYGWYVSNSPVS